jgi:N utilization substance protein A
VNELNGERIDVVLWDPEPGRFVAHALSPAQVVNVEVDETTNTAEVVVPDRQLSLAIGKEGQNARLAAKLTGWRIDIKSQSVYDEVMAALAPPEEEAAGEAPAEAPESEAELAPEEEPAPVVEEAGVAVAAGEASAEAVAAPRERKGPQVRFAEEILPGGREEPGGKVKAKKAAGKGEEEEAAKTKKAKRPKRIAMEEEDEEDEGFDVPVH